MRLFTVLVSAALITMPVALQAQDTAVIPPAEPAKPPKPKKICRAAEVSSTSRMGTGRVCKTEAEWAAANANGDNNGNGGRSTQSLSAD